MNDMTQTADFSQQKSPTSLKQNYYHEFHKLPLEMNKIVFSNFHGKAYGCNPKYITEALRKYDGLDLVWMTLGGYEYPEYVRTVPFNSPEALQEMATARVLVDNQMKFPGFVKRPDQFFIDTWHGAIPLKKIGYDNPSNVGKKKYQQRLSLNFNAIDLITSNSRFCTDMFRRSFHYKGLFLESGCPRNDIFFRSQESVRQKVCAALSVPDSKKLLLYAPTFRNDRGLEHYQLNYERLLSRLGDDWIILIRLHPHIQKKASRLTTYTDRIVSASSYPDMQELMAASDIMVTDYSNIMFEFSLTGRPCVLYATDVEEYRAERDYYFEITELPFPLTTSTEELADAICNFDSDAYRKSLKRFQSGIRMKETGHAADDVAKIIFQMTQQKDFSLERAVYPSWTARMKHRWNTFRSNHSD